MHNFPRNVFRSIKRHRYLNTWSSLATVFNKTVNENDTNYVTKTETGLFGVPDLKQPDGFNVWKDAASRRTTELIEEATSNKRERKMIQIFDELSNTLCEVADLAEFIRVAHPDKYFSNTARDTCIFISDIVEKLNTHRELYDSLRNVSINGDIEKTSTIDDHVTKLFLFDFEQSGIHLPEAQRQKVTSTDIVTCTAQAIVAYMKEDINVQVGQQFMAGATSPRAIRGEHIPNHLKKHFTVDNNHVIVQGCYSYTSDPGAREAAYKLYLYPDEEQEYLLSELLNSRQDLAELCGFPSYAHRAVKGSTMETPMVVHEFLNILNDELKLRAKEEFDEMQKMKNAETLAKQDLMPWDVNYFTAKAKNTWLNISTAEFSPYFSLGACMDGLNMLTQALYGVELKPVPIAPGEVWANNITKLAVMDENEGVLGHIYCDFFNREGKINQDCHFCIRGSRRLSDGSYQNPIAVLMLSLPQPKWSNPCLLNPSYVENLFHEMGHALHSMLGRTEYQHVCGTRCSTDFAEVPSILMEYFATDPRVVSKFAKHYQTQEPIPEELLKKLQASKSVFGASELQTQVFYSMLDQVYHSTKLNKSSTEILKEIHENYYGLPYVEKTAWQLRFSHLVAYGAKYYSYLVSRAIASWIWQTYFEEDPFNRLSGERYRKECLAHGGGKPPSKLVSDFLNKEASANNLARSLLHELDQKNLQMQAIKR